MTTLYMVVGLVILGLVVAWIVGKFMRGGL